MDGKLRYEQLDGKEHDLTSISLCCCRRSRAPVGAYDKDGNDITSELFAPSGFLKVDADYSGKPYEEWSAGDWPHKYESPRYPNIFAPGIAFAPPHPISQPRKSSRGTVIAEPAAHRHAIGRHGQDGRRDHPGRPQGPSCRCPWRVHGDNGRPLRRLGRYGTSPRFSRGNDDVLGGSRPGAVPADWS